MSQPPNILFITCHDLGHHLGCYGITSVSTPHLDQIAADGTRFTHSFATSPGCSPSRAALATGRYPHCCGVLGLAHAHFGWGLGPAERHVAGVLADSGYHSTLFGLQHVTYRLDRLGFAEIHPERQADAVVGNLETFLARRGTMEKPFYAEVNFFEPHRPFDFGGVEPDSSRGVFVPAYLPDSPASRGELAAMQGAIRKVDQSVARIDAALAAAGLRERTLLVFTADHGIAFPRAKGTLYDPGIETALLVRWPGSLPSGRVLDPLVSNIDLLPTLLQIAGAGIPSPVQGRSLYSLLRGERYPERDAVYAEKTFHNEYDPLRAVRTKTHKLIARFEASNPLEVPADIMRGPTYPEMLEQVVEPRSQELELYDLRADPLEQNNLAGQTEHAEVQKALTRQLHAWMVKTDDPLLRGPVASPFYYRTLQALRGA